jgi:hypothetical protein
MDSVFENLPLTAGKQEAIKRAQQDAFNSSVMAKTGTVADNANPETILALKERLGNDFNNLASRNSVKVDDKLLEDLSGIEQSYKRNLTPDQHGIVGNYIDDILGQSGSMSGETYQKARSSLGRRAFNASDKELGSTLKDIQSALDGAATRSISPEDAKAWETANKEYGNMKTVEDTMKRQNSIAAGGDISPAALMGSAIKQRKGAFTSGSGDYNDLARIGQVFLKDQIPNSGTAQRQFYQNLATGAGIAGVAGGYGYGNSGDPVEALKYALRKRCSPKVAQTDTTEQTGTSIPD